MTQRMTVDENLITIAGAAVAASVYLQATR